MLKIYSIAISLYCSKLRILLRQKKLQWQEVEPPGGYGSTVYKLIIPSGNLPALIDDALVLSDSEAIAEYINEKYPEPPMLPEDIALRGRIRELSRFHDTRLEPELRVMFAHIKPANCDRALLENQCEKISQRLYQMSVLLDADNCGHLEKDELMLCDCGYPVTFEWINQLTPLLELNIEWPDAVLTYLENGLRQSSVAAEMAAYRPILAQYLNDSGAK